MLMRGVSAAMGVYQRTDITGQIRVRAEFVAGAEFLTAWRAAGLYFRPWRGPSGLERQPSEVHLQRSRNESALRVSPGLAWSRRRTGWVAQEARRGGSRAYILCWPGRVVRGVLDDLVTTAFPADCRVCGQPLLRLESLLSASLSDGGAAAAIWRCVVAAARLWIWKGSFCRAVQRRDCCVYPCRMVPPDVRTRRCVLRSIEDELREMMHLLKYERMRGCRRGLAECWPRRF